MAHVSDIKLIRTDTTLDLSQKAEKAAFRLVALYVQDVGFRRCMQQLVCKLLLKANGEHLGLYWEFSYPEIENGFEIESEDSHAKMGTSVSLESNFIHAGQISAFHFWFEHF
ncbi:hypothetical protein J1N35_044129 [Gossypium stocksii]|uniref:Uncharacterized protein n=1 Tax=Gossypium stocksii TaxID=47602 RepID=A0A9D3ZFQ4_9ROSI|nr:hypothetical protein J1N35_044129 [Gossypium stocksii]